MSIFYNSLYRKIDHDCEELRKTALDAQEELFSEIEDNWQAIQNVRSDISYIPKREEIKDPLK